MSSTVHQNVSPPITWLRPESLRGDEYSFSQLPWAVTRNPSSDDIVQGRLGNCWLLFVGRFNSSYIKKVWIKLRMYAI